MTNKEAQTELRRSTKTPDKLYKIALSYQRGDKYAKSYKVTSGGLKTAPGVAYKERPNQSVLSERDSEGHFNRVPGDHSGETQEAGRRDVVLITTR